MDLNSTFKRFSELTDQIEHLRDMYVEGLIDNDRKLKDLKTKFKNDSALPIHSINRHNDTIRKKRKELKILMSSTLRRTDPKQLDIKKRRILMDIEYSEELLTTYKSELRNVKNKYIPQIIETKRELKKVEELRPQLEKLKKLRRNLVATKAGIAGMTIAAFVSAAYLWKKRQERI